MWKKKIQKVVTMTMTITMLSTVILSSGVSAVESYELSDNESQKKSVELDTDTLGGKEESIEEKEIAEENHIEEKDIIEKEDDISYVESDSSSETSTENDETITEEYFSVEENREKAIEIMNQEKNSMSTFSMKSRSIPKTDAFISAVSYYATSVADEYNLYASVMIAQAALESAWGTSILAYAPNYNLFGIKAGTGDPYFAKYSKEYSAEKGWSVEKSNFKTYSSYKNTFLDYAKKLRKGPDWNSSKGSWDPKYYSGTWKENADSYTNATKALTGKYATDPTYNTKLNDIIKTYDLTQYDKKNTTDKEDPDLSDEIKDLSYDEITSTTNVKDYTAYITGDTDGIYSAPKGTVNSKVNADASGYFNKKVIVTEEAKTKSGMTWAKISLNGKSIGWIDKNGVSTYDIILSEKTVNYIARINRKTDTINTKPDGTKGYKKTATSSQYYGKEVRIKKEAVTSRSTYVLISLNGKELGWIDKKGLDIEKILSTTDVKDYKATISRSTDGINSKPYGTEGYVTKYYSSKYLGTEITVKKEAKTHRATWVLIALNGKELGWIDKNGVSTYDIILSEKTVNYIARINRKAATINTKPYGIKGYKKAASTSTYNGKEVKVTKEVVTNRSTYLLISLNGKELGWIDKKGLDIEKILSTTDVKDYKATIIRSTDGINSKPYGTEGYVTKYYSSKYIGTEITVKKEAKTHRATWALIALNGKELGWIDKAGLNKINPFKKTVYVDAGHGGKDPGAESGGVKEKDLNLKVALKVRAKLEKKGYNVVMSRTTDVFLELSEIARKANNSNADIFVSIHHNAFNKNLKGIETFSYNSLGSSTNPMSKNLARLASSEKLAKSTQQQMLSYTGAVDRKAKKADFHVIRQTNMPAALLELGFIDNASERGKLVTNSYQEKLANGIVQGIVDYFK